MNAEKIVVSCQALLKRGWLSERSEHFQETLLANALQRGFETGETLYHYGDRADGLYAVLSGAIRVTTPADDGQEFVAHRDEMGFWVGDLAMLSDATRLVTVEATCATETLFIPAARILKMVDETPEYYRDFYALTHDNMKLALRVLANLAVTNATTRLMLRLLHLDETLNKSGDWIAVSQEELASLVAISVPTLQRSLRRCVADGHVELGYGRIRVLNRKALMQMCQS